MAKYRVVFQPGNIVTEVAEGSTVMEAMNQTNLHFDYPCGGRGRCGKCRVQVLEGIADATDVEREFLSPGEITAGIRLACVTKVYHDVCIKLPDKKLEHKILMAAEERAVAINPPIRKTYVEVDKPSLEDHRTDWHRLRDGLQQAADVAVPRINLQALRQLPETLREAKFNLTLMSHGSEVLGLEAQDTTGTLLGMAFDIGTTTIVGYLIDLNSGRELCVVSTINPQTKFGADVISRITFIGQDEAGLEKLHHTVIEAINTLIGEAVEMAGVKKRDIYAVTVAGNTCMHHLFLGVNPRYVAVSPYVPAISEPVELDASELAIDINPIGRVFVIPNIAGFVGADTTAVLLATELDKSKQVKLMIDIGTNGEIALGSEEKIVTCSAAAGPAFEGAQISSGMRGAIGAIDHIYFKEKLEFSVIGGGAPVGICGSALLDAVSGMLQFGILDRKGKILPPDKIADPRFKDRVITYEGMSAFLLVEESGTGHGRPIMITQRDIREFQLAKGAMAAGVDILLRTYGIDVNAVDEVLLAGAFGNYMNPHSACAVGLIPKELEAKVKMVGNAAGTGAKLALLSYDEYQRTRAIADNAQFVELGSFPGFSNIFAKCMYF